MLNYPEINPIALKLGPLAIHWYGIMYVVGVVGGWGFLRFRLDHFRAKWTLGQLSDLTTWGCKPKPPKFPSKPQSKYHHSKMARNVSLRDSRKK
jgi:hypothetical protein